MTADSWQNLCKDSECTLDTVSHKCVVKLFGNKNDLSNVTVEEVCRETPDAGREHIVTVNGKPFHCD